MQLSGAGRPRCATHCPGKCVLGDLQATQIPGGHATHQTVAIVESSGNDSLGDHLGTVEIKPRSDVSQGPDVVIAATNNCKHDRHRQLIIKLDAKQFDGLTELDMCPSDVDSC